MIPPAVPTSAVRRGDITSRAVSTSAARGGDMAPRAVSTSAARRGDITPHVSAAEPSLPGSSTRAVRNSTAVRHCAGSFLDWIPMMFLILPLTVAGDRKRGSVPPTATDSHRQPPTATDSHRQPPTATDSHRQIVVASSGQYHVGLRRTRRCWSGAGKAPGAASTGQVRAEVPTGTGASGAGSAPFFMAPATRRGTSPCGRGRWSRDLLTCRRALSASG
jgi:hypothetical protein